LEAWGYLFISLFWQLLLHEFVNPQGVDRKGETGFTGFPSISSRWLQLLRLRWPEFPHSLRT
jgi:hypothetical protein